MSRLPDRTRNPWARVSGRSKSYRRSVRPSRYRECCPASCYTHLKVGGIEVRTITKPLSPTALEAGFVPLVTSGNLLLCSEDCLAAGGAEVGSLGGLDDHDGLLGMTEE